MSKVVLATLDGKGLGATINALAKEGKVKPCIISLETGEVHCNSTWAATDWLNENGFYGDGKNSHVRYELIWPLG